LNSVKLKIGRNVFDIDENDVVMDNGAIIQVITKKSGTGWNWNIPVMSKKLYGDLKKLNILYTNKELEEYASQSYSSKVTLYKFDIEKMKNEGY